VFTQAYDPPSPPGNGDKYDLLAIFQSLKWYSTHQSVSRSNNTFQRAFISLQKVDTNANASRHQQETQIFVEALCVYQLMEAGDVGGYDYNFVMNKVYILIEKYLILK
jgi:hypothetical protein